MGGPDAAPRASVEGTQAARRKGMFRASIAVVQEKVHLLRSGSWKHSAPRGSQPAPPDAVPGWHAVARAWAAVAPRHRNQDLPACLEAPCCWAVLPAAQVSARYTRMAACGVRLTRAQPHVVGRHIQQLRTHPSSRRPTAQPPIPTETPAPQSLRSLPPGH